MPARTTKVRNGGGGGGGGGGSGSRVTCALAMSTDMENCVFAAKILAIGSVDALLALQCEVRHGDNGDNDADRAANPQVLT